MRKAAALLLLALASCPDRPPPGSTGPASTSVAPDAKSPTPTRAPDAAPPARTPALRDETTSVTEDGIALHARLLLSKLTAADGIRVALAIEAAPGHEPKAGISVPLDWARTLSSLRLHVDRGGKTVTLELATVSSRTGEYIGRSGGITRVLRIDGQAVADDGGLAPWTQPKPDLLATPGEYTLRIEGEVHLSGKAVSFATSPLAFEIVAPGPSFQPLAELATVAASAASAEHGLSGRPDPHVVEDVAGQRWFRFLGEGSKPYESRVVEVLVSPSGQVVATHSYEYFNCVASGTPVATPRGDVSIERLSPGDVVWSFDLERRERVETVVRRVALSTTDELFDIAGLRVTGEHPVYADGRFTAARELAPGASLLSAAGLPLRLDASGTTTGHARVVDISVDWPHNFFASGLLVHNKAQHVPPGGSGPGERWRGIFNRSLAGPTRARGAP